MIEKIGDFSFTDIHLSFRQWNEDQYNPELLRLECYDINTSEDEPSSNYKKSGTAC